LYGVPGIREKKDVDHFDLGFKTNVFSDEVMGKLFPAKK